MGAGPLARATRSTAAVYALAEGHRVTVLIDASETGGAFDLIEVVAPPGPVSPPHRHEFVEWYHVVEGTLRVSTARDQGPAAPVLVEAAATFVVPTQVVHAIENPAEGAVRFIVAGFPAVTSSFVAKAGVRVRDVQTPPPVLPQDQDALNALAGSFGIDLRKDLNA
ncbi:MAG TPA: cupin domain-containing protein [Solirubrobacterales bacterium]|nr:cupin domain-containing protein [Solirubrobacterales bacterium]